MPGGLDLLLLHAVLDGLRVDQLLQLLLLGDQQVVLVGGGLGGHLTRGVEHRAWIDWQGTRDAKTRKLLFRDRRKF